jgi:dihydrofolate reductase
MGKVVLDISMSLDGFIAGPNDNHGQPLGEGGEQLHDWIWRDSSMINNPDLMQGGTAGTTGAMLVGRRTYDLVDGWGGSHPIPGVPVFVLTHDMPAEHPEGETPLIFVTDGIQSAIDQAKAAAGDRNIYIIGGAKVAQQCIRAGLLDEIRLHLVHILLGSGARLFEDLGPEPIELEATSTIDAPGVTHLHFQVVNKQGRLLGAHPTGSHTQAQVRARELGPL